MNYDEPKRRPWPVPMPPGCVRTYRPTQELNLSTLPPEKKRQWWERVKKKDPGLADLLQNDQTFRALIETFDAEIIIELEPYRGEY